MLRSCVQLPLLHQSKGLLYAVSRSPVTLVRYYAQPQQSGGSNALAAARERNDVSTDVRPLGERIKENTKTASYMGVIVLGVTVTGALMFAIFRELWSSNSSNSVYSAALERCINVSKLLITYNLWKNIF